MSDEKLRIKKVSIGWKWQILRPGAYRWRVKREGWRFSKSGAEQAGRNYITRQQRKGDKAQARRDATYTINLKDE